LDDDAVETVRYKNQEAFQKLGEGFHRSPPQKIWLDTKIICPGGRWNQPSLQRSMRSLRLGDLAREKRAPMTENAIAREIVDRFPHSHDGRSGLAGVGLSNGVGV